MIMSWMSWMDKEFCFYSICRTDCFTSSEGSSAFLKWEWARTTCLTWLLLHTPTLVWVTPRPVWCEIIVLKIWSIGGNYILCHPFFGSLTSLGVILSSSSSNYWVIYQTYNILQYQFIGFMVIWTFGEDSLGTFIQEKALQWNNDFC